MVIEEAKNLLFVCTVAMQRSPTAASIFENSSKYNAKYAGVHPSAEINISKEAIRWADVIFVMEPFQEEFISKNFPDSDGKKIVILDIPDKYYKNDPELISILKKKLNDFVKN